MASMAASNTKLASLLLLFLTLFLCTAADPILACGTCGNTAKGGKPPSSGHHYPPKGHSKPPVIFPPIIGKPPATFPPAIKPPPVTFPPIVRQPPVTFPPVVKQPPVTFPPVIRQPPVTFPPIVGGGSTPPVIETPGGNNNCPTTPVVGGGSPAPVLVPPPPPATCPADSLKLGACVDLLGGLVHVVIGDPVVNTCCPILGGLAELEAAVCLCSTIKLKLLNIDIYLPLALRLLLTCGKNPPPSYTCPESSV